jgi:hypothetical protein
MQEQPEPQPSSVTPEVVIEDADGTAAHDARFLLSAN